MDRPQLLAPRIKWPTLPSVYLLMTNASLGFTLNFQLQRLQYEC
jgi:hypothetical protein